MGDRDAHRDEPYVVRIVEDRWTTWRHVIEGVAIVAAGLWAFYTFIYQEHIKPAGEPAALAPKIVVERLGRDATRDIVSVKLQLRNVGKTEIDIAAEAIDIYGIRYGDKAIDSRKKRGAQVALFTHQVPEISRSVVFREYELRAAAKGGIPGYHIISEPDASAELPETVVVRRGAYDALEVVASVVPVKTSIGHPVIVGVRRDKDGGYALVPDEASGADEDSIGTTFALIP